MKQIKVDYLIVGSGLTGSVIARLLSDAKREVLVVERRSNIGGNLYDYTHQSGIRVHAYGPHYFRTNSEEIWKFVNRFARFYKYEASLRSYVDGRYENWPVTDGYLKRAVGEKWEPEWKKAPSNFEEASLSLMPRVVYEKFVKGYTEKQWDTRAENLSKHLAKRFDIRKNNDARLKLDKYQGIPFDGYTGFIQRLLSNIPVLLNFDYLSHRDILKVQRLVIFTGPIDEFFGFDMGRLAYRGQKRTHNYIPDVDYILPCGQVNNPGSNNGAHIRTIEWKHMMPPRYAERIKGTLLTREIPFSPADPDDYEYPFPDKKNASLYEMYRRRAETINGLLFCGRLGEYRYYDMDQAIERAIVLAQEIIAKIDHQYFSYEENVKAS
jgi:UDP-galactopyranose mutase